MSIIHSKSMPHWSPPSISSVRAFEAVARLLSFTRAANELNLTQSAISHGVRDLEARLGVNLFVRQGRSLSLSDAGRLYLPFAADALARLRGGDSAVLDPQRKARVLTVSVSPSFAAKWLVPRLGAFSATHPDLDLRISANPQHIHFGDGEIDVAVRHGNGDWPHLYCTRLCEETLFPVCSPTLLVGSVPLSPDALANHTLIHHLTTDAWTKWFQTCGAAPPRSMAHGPVLSEMSLVIDAAMAGQGVALARSALVSRDLRERRLVRASQQELSVGFAYWIVCPPEAAERAKIARFRDWLVSEAQQDVGLQTSQAAVRKARKRKIGG